MASYQGPIKPGTSESTFRKTGKSVSVYQGPVRPTDNEETFRKTGVSTGGGGRGGGGGSSAGGGSSGGGSSGTTSPNIQILRNGEVQVGSGLQARYYMGNAIVPDLNKTANQVQLELRQQYKRDTGKAIGMGRVSGTITRQQQRQSNEPTLLDGMSILPNQAVLPGQGLFDTSDKIRTSRGTNINYGKVNIQYQGQAEQGQYIKKEIVNGKPVYTYVDASVEGYHKERPATMQEFAYYNEQMANVINPPVIEEKKGFITRVTDFQTESIRGLYGGAIDTIILPLEQATSKVIDVGSMFYGQSTPGGKKVGEFTKGVVVGSLEDIRTQPGKNIVLLGAGYGLGLAFKGIATGVTLVPKVGGYLSSGVKVAGYGAGVGLTTLYGAETYAKVMQTPGAYNKGSITGVALKDLAITGFGFARGEKGFVQLKGLYETRGKEFVDVKQGDYPSAPSSKQLSLFQKNIYPQLGKEAISFHTTPGKFWTDTISPDYGSSEIGGMYGSTYVSRPFAKIQGKGSSYSILPNKGMFAPETTPGIVGLKPEGFRNVGISFSNKKLFEGQKYVKGRGFAFFTKQPKMGFMDIPKNFKSEIESIARPGAGEYSLQSKNFYTEIYDTRVSLDVAKYSKENKINTQEFKVKGSKGKGTKVDLGSYSLPQQKYSVTNIGSSLTSFGKSNKSYVKSSRVSLSSYTPSSYVPSSTGYSGSSRVSPSYSGKSYGGGSSGGLSSGRLSYSGLSSGKVSYSGLSSGGRSYGGYSSTPSRNPPKIIKLPSLPRNKGKSGGLFSVSVRRGGVFKTIGSGLSLSKALSVGRGKVSTSLGATFKITSPKGTVGGLTPKGFYQKTSKKEGITYIELPKYRISTGGEKREIKLAKWNRR